MHNPFRHSFLLILFFCPFFLHGQPPVFSFTNLDKNSGLASNWCHVAYRDSRGYMWFGTQDGLSHYDGAQVTNFLHAEGDETSLGGNIVKDIVEDRNGRLWIATNGGGLSCYDPDTGQFKTYRYEHENPNSLSCPMVVALYLDDEDVLWMGNYDCGFHSFDLKNGIFNRYVLPDTFDTRQEAFKKNSVIDIVPDVSNPDVLWLAGNNGLYRFDKRSGRLDRFNSRLPGAGEAGIFSLLMENPHEIWMGTYGAGLVRFEIATGRWQHFFPDPGGWQKRSEKANLVYSVKRKSPQELWIASQSEGLAVFDIRTAAFRFIHPVPEDPVSFGSKEAYNICPDRENLVWITTRRRGVFLLDPYYDIFHLKSLCPGGCNGTVVPGEVTGFAWDNHRGKLYVTARGTGDLFVFNRKFELEKRVGASAKDLPGAGNNAVMVDASGGIWIGGTPGEGRQALYRYFPEEGKVAPFQHRLTTAKIPLHRYEVNDLLEDSRRRIWLATTYGGLVQIDMAGDTLIQYIAEDPADPLPTQSMKLSDLIEDKSGKIWMSTRDHGIYCFDPATGSFENYFNRFDMQPGLTENIVNTLAEDRNGRIWIGTNANGINVLNPASAYPANLSFLDMKDDLPDNHILKMVKDHRENIWVYTISGLAFFDENRQKFTVYDENYGLRGQHSWEDGLFVAAGNIFIGNKARFYFIQLDSLPKVNDPPPVVLTRLRIFDEEQTFDKNLNDLGKIVLRYDQNFFSIGFAALNYRHPEKNRYAYILEGFNRDWVYLPAGQQTANFTNVPEGTYNFQVIAANDTGTWNHEGASITVVVLPPWYRTWWAWLLYVLAFAGAVYLAHRYQVSRFDLRTRLAMEKKEAEQLRELNQLRTRLYTNVTHEFRTPLTVILGLAGEISGNEKYRELIIRNGRRLLRLVTQILDLSKIEHGSLQLHLEKGDIRAFLQYITESFQSMAASKNLELTFSAGSVPEKTDFDPERLQQVMYNLLSNAIKFTPENGKIAVQIKTAGEALLVRVSDTGGGIGTSDLPHIFNPFFQAENARSAPLPGTGIGLALTAELVKLMGGHIEVKSELERGTHFTVTLPLYDRESVPEMSTVPVTDKGIVQYDFENQFPVPVEHPAETEIHARPVILLAEDNPDLVLYLNGILKHDYTLEVAADGLAGIEKAIETVPDLVITDVMMPRADGLELCRRLKNDERTSHIPIIMLTAKAGIEDRIAGLERGADAYLAKPFNRQELLVEIRKLLDIRKRLQQRYATFSPPAPAPSEVGLKMDDAFVRKAIEAIHEQLSEEGFGPDGLAGKLFISRSQLHRKLSALTGLSASHFIRSVRLKKALEMLQQGSTVSETALAVGFSDLSYFSKVFKDEFGKSPSKMKKS